MIRAATLDDCRAMLAMAEKFVGQAWGRVGVGYDEATCSRLLTHLIENDLGILLISNARDAMMGAVIHPWHFNADVMTATELFWWAEPGCRDAMAMVTEAERRAKALGAHTFNMACQSHMRGAALGRLYERRGYASSEHIYIKELH